ncbi:hypothetical protein [Aliarcobacter cryaerophilus]|uniref:hypothetical protein n=1 Tax=Aliarcobacter cryaerophilus TaxID=28198 RepID=UPI003DA4F73A
MKIIFIMILILFKFSNAENIIKDNYGHLSNEELVSKMSSTLQMLIVKNGGGIDTGKGEKLIGITSMRYPATIKWLFSVDIQTYKKDLLIALENQNLKINKNDFIKKVNSEWLLDMIKQETKKNVLIQSCTREDYRYMLNRGINLDWTYIEDRTRKIIAMEFIKKGDCKLIKD